MKTTVLNKYRLLYNIASIKHSTGVCVRAMYDVLGTPPVYILYMVCSYVESKSVLVADGDTTSVLLCRQQIAVQ